MVRSRVMSKSPMVILVMARGQIPLCLMKMMMIFKLKKNWLHTLEMNWSKKKPNFSCWNNYMLHKMMSKVAPNFKKKMWRRYKQGASSQPVKSSMQLPPKKGQNLPPPPPLKASAVLTISTFHPPRDVPGQPRLLPKGSSNAQSQSSNSGSSKITLILINFVCDYSGKFLPSSFPGSSVFLPRERKRGDLGARLNFLSSEVQ